MLAGRFTDWRLYSRYRRRDYRLPRLSGESNRQRNAERNVLGRLAPPWSSSARVRGVKSPFPSCLIRQRCYGMRPKRPNDR